MRQARQAFHFWILSSLIAGCAGPGAPSLQFSTSTQRMHALSWISPAATENDLLYVSNASTNDVYVYTYPQGKRVGQLTGFKQPAGLCVDEAGDVFVTNVASTVVEYAHGGTTPIATLQDPGYAPHGCSVDPTTGNLAVTNSCRLQGSRCSGQGGIAVYLNAQGTPTLYHGSRLYGAVYCGYDSDGNLFTDGFEKTYSKPHTVFAELPKGGQKFIWIKFHHIFGGEGEVQWDGKYIAVGDTGSSRTNAAIYRTTPSGHIVGTTILFHSVAMGQFWIAPSRVGQRVIGPDYYRVGYWAYPKSGGLYKVIPGPSGEWGATVSLASQPRRWLTGPNADAVTSRGSPPRTRP